MGRHLDGVDDKIDFGDKAVFKILGDLSWASWIYIDSGGANALICDVSGGSGESEADNQVLFLFITGAAAVWDLTYNHENGNGSNNLKVFNTNLAQDVWIHVAVVRDVSANTVILYIDGVAFETFNYTNDPTNTSSDLSYRLGERPDGTDPFLGSLAEDVLANVAWSADEVRTIWHRASIARGSVNYAPLFGNASPEPDFSGNGNNGTLTGTTQVDHPPVAPPFGFDMGWQGEFGGAAPATVGSSRGNQAGPMVVSAFI